jgi:hypothetical protein
MYMAGRKEVCGGKEEGTKLSKGVPFDSFVPRAIFYRITLKKASLDEEDSENSSKGISKTSSFLPAVKRYTF